MQECLRRVACLIVVFCRIFWRAILQPRSICDCGRLAGRLGWGDHRPRTAPFGGDNPA